MKFFLLILILSLSFSSCRGAPAVEEAAPDSPPLDPWVSSSLEAMTPAQKAGQLLILHFHSVPGKPESTKVRNPVMDALVREIQPGGVIFFQDNFETADQTRALTSGLQSLAAASGPGIPLFLAADEEGGRVARLGRKPAMESPNLPSARKLGQGGAEKVRAAGAALGAAMVRLGLNMNLGPIADLDTVPGNPLGDRAFSSDPRTAGELAAAFLEGFQSQGVLGIAKHFPGLGMVTVDPHFGSAVWDWDKARFDSAEGVPFLAVRGAAGFMIAHLDLRGLEPEVTPAPWSEKLITGLLRKEWNYQGLVMTDALNMGAVQGATKPGEETLRALLAGADMVLMPPDPQAAVRRVLAALEGGELPVEVLDRAVQRILEAKSGLSRLK